MSKHFNTQYEKHQIENKLKLIKRTIKNNDYRIELNQNRLENKNFINQYNLDHKKRLKLLLSLEVEDFCFSCFNTKKEYSHEILYVFVLQTKLFNINDELENVNIYFKFNIINKSNNHYTVVISFHHANKRFKYIFK